MKTFLVLSIIFLTACTKKNHNLGPDYDQFIGTWETINTSENAIMKVKKNGKIEISHAIDRNLKFIVQNSSIWDYSSNPNDWSAFRFTTTGEDYTGIIFYINKTQDSLKCSRLVANVNNGELSYPNKTAIFTRK